MKEKNNIQRCVHIFPRFQDSKLINDFRQKYDYLHQYIEPHITLVFPFFSELTDNEIAADLIKLVKDINSFEIICSGFSQLKGKENCIVMNLLSGFDDVFNMHYLVHKGILKPYQSKITMDGSYVPHMTIGRFNNEADMEIAFKKLENENWKFNTIIKNIFIEEIGRNEESIIKNEIGLKG